MPVREGVQQRLPERDRFSYPFGPSLGLAADRAGRVRRRRCPLNHSTAGTSGSSSSGHQDDAGFGDRGSVTVTSASEVGGAVGGMPGKLALDGLPPPPGVADAVVFGVPAADGVLDGVLAWDGADVRGGLGAAMEPLEPSRDMFEAPLLWYPSVARIM